VKNGNEKTNSIVNDDVMEKNWKFTTPNYEEIEVFEKMRKISQNYTIDYLHTHIHTENQISINLTLILLTFDY